jgi:hypothetical protein
MHSEKEQRGRGTVDGNLHLYRRSTRSFVSFGGGSASAARWRGLVSERQWREERMATGEASREGLGF